MKPQSLLPCALVALSVFALLPLAHAAGAAPDGPGLSSTWSPAQKSFLGTSTTDASQVYFSGYRGIVTEVFYPTLDNAQTLDLQFLVGDHATTFVDEEKAQSGYSATRPNSRSMRWNTSVGHSGHNWQITKNIFTDPTRNALIQRVTFTALNGKAVRDFNLYLLHNPSINNSGSGDTAKILTSNGRTMLVASESTRASALAVSSGWKVNGGNTMASVGFVGTSDGWTDLLGGSVDKTMSVIYDTASGGNVAQMGWIDFGGSTATSISFDVVLGFGATEAEATSTANAVLNDNLTTLQSTYDNGWQSYTSGLSTQGGTADDQYYLAAMSLKSIQDKSNGAMIAGMGTPWGETASDTTNSGGYHLVWARDLFKFANALITAGDTASATSAVKYLFNVQQEATGRFPQNSQINGTAYWNGTQMDQQAMPILLAYRLGATVYNPLWSKIKLSADYIVSNGPWTQQERWEENSGYSPSTIAAEIAGLVVASKIAQANGDTTRAATYMRVADYWQQNVQGWTYTSTGIFGSGKYYIRLNPASKVGSGSGLSYYGPSFGPDTANYVSIGNGGGTHDQRKVVDGGFLELVRMGVKSPSNAAIASTIAVYDATLKQAIASKGDAWFRYNFDGYGEANDGSNYSGNGGRGRLWPIFTAERGMFEIARTGLGSNGSTYLSAVKAFSTPEGFIPEQVWNYSSLVTSQADGGWQTITPSSYTAGSPTKSIAPLSWAMGEYINLLAAIYTGSVADIPQAVCLRYYNCNMSAGSGEVQATINVNASTSWGQYLYVTGNTAALGNWNTDLGLPADPGSYPTWKHRVNLPASTTIQYKYYRKNSDGSVTWEFLSGGGNRRLNAPASGTVTLNDTVAWQ